LPHDFGGVGDPTSCDKYASLRQFKETEELPLIKPKTTANKQNEFNVVFDQTKEREEAIDVN